MKKLLLATLFSLSSLSAFAEIKTITLNVPTMNCATCPITVKHSLKNVAGVETAQVSFEKKQAIVSYDDSKTNVKALINATTNAGYPSTVNETTSKHK